MSVAKFIDNLLDNWKGIPSTSTPASFAAADAAADVIQIQTALKKLYLVFHYPQENTNFGTLVPAQIDRIFNYVYADDTPAKKKTLLSTNGITKANMITLKMLLDEIKTASTPAKALEILNRATTEVVVPNATLGGSNTMVPKIGGKNKSNKRVRKIRKRNKSSKSHRSAI